MSGDTFGKIFCDRAERLVRADTLVTSKLVAGITVIRKTARDNLSFGFIGYVEGYFGMGGSIGCRVWKFSGSANGLHSREKETALPLRVSAVFGKARVPDFISFLGFAGSGDGLLFTGGPFLTWIELARYPSC